MQTSNLEILQNRLGEAIQEVALLKHALYLANESLKVNGKERVVGHSIASEVVVRNYYSKNVDMDGAEKAYILELGRLLFKAGIIPSSAIFDEQTYLADNPDVAQAIATRRFGSGFEHWLVHGLSEGRTVTSKIVNVDHLGDDVISAYRSYKVRKAKSPLSYLLRFLTMSRRRQQV
ncbi:hypothetical protein [Rhizobium sp. SG741]|uniref:hypothetical protein n=1 Tax=Rhizobium sp. SG741 TaxID=2587114 RepID=UPI001444A75C|nr:hypothetical protein [Rhizobium sp. SG741]NKJ09806.1 hypothetical protein [Rhizobium sp. SG741]